MIQFSNHQEEAAQTELPKCKEEITNDIQEIVVEQHKQSEERNDIEEGGEEEKHGEREQQQLNLNTEDWVPQTDMFSFEQKNNVKLNTKKKKKKKKVQHLMMMAV